MNYSGVFAFGLGVIVAASSSAATPDSTVLGTFRPLASNQSTDPAIYVGHYDTWVFKVHNAAPENVTAFGLSFKGSFLQTLGGSNAFFVQEFPMNPVTDHGDEWPETFIVVPPTFSHDLLVAPGSLVDLATSFEIAYTVLPSRPLMAPGENRPVAFFSVPAGTTMGALNFSGGLAHYSSSLIMPIIFVPEPSTVALVSWSFLSVLGIRRRTSCSMQR